MAATADDNDDCEVIFENSPLHWSMVDAGLEDLGHQDVQRVKHVSSSSDSSTTGHGKFPWSRICKRCSEEIMSLFLLRHNNKTQVEEMHRQVFATLTHSSLLTEEDSQFLQDLKSEELQKETMVAQSISSRKWPAVLCTIVTCVFLLALTLWRPFLLHHPWQPFIFSSLLALLLPLLLTQAAKGWHRRSFWKRGEMLQGSVRTILRSAGKWSEVSAKCVRFIQESELVAKGFTFVGKPGSIRAVKELQGTSTWRRQCPLLRKTLFLNSHSVFFSWRRSFARLVQICPVKVELSGVMHYCSEIPLSQYPTMLQQDNDGKPDEEGMTSLHEMSDDFSIDVLKSLQELNSIHMSEFLRRLAVCFISFSEKIDFCAEIPPLLDSVSHELERLCTDLQSCLTAHRHGAVNAASKSGKSRAWQPASSASQLRSTYTAVHSLELHLLAALKKIQDLSESMERELDEEENQNTTDDRKEVQEAVEEDPVRKSWKQMLMTVRSELGACSGCLEEGVKQLEEKAESESKVMEMNTKAQVPTTSPTVNVIRVSAQDSPIILDEVFEAYSEPQDFDGWRSHCELTATEEEVWQKKQKSNLKQCLNELQSIIDVRAAQRQERERIAMDRMKDSPSGTTHTLQGPHVSSHNRYDPEGRQLTPEETLMKRVSMEQCESVEDLAKDVAKRVEFWKQFDLEVNSALTNCDAEKTCPTIKDFDGKESAGVINKDTSIKDNICKAEERADCDEHLRETKDFHRSFEEKENYDKEDCDENSKEKECCDEISQERENLSEKYEEREICRESAEEFQDKESRLFFKVVGGSYSQDSAFGFVSDQMVPSDSSMLDPTSLDSERKDKEFQKPQIPPLSAPSYQVAQNTSDHNLDNVPSKVSPSQQNCIDFCDEHSDDIEEDSCKNYRRGEDGDVLLGQSQTSSFQKLPTCQEELTSSDTRGLNKIDNMRNEVRSSPEGVMEHLSLPAAPSPFAFSIASLVASRARHLAHVEDTFGDSSSEEEGEEEDRRVGEMENVS